MFQNGFRNGFERDSTSKLKEEGARSLESSALEHKLEDFWHSGRRNRKEVDGTHALRLFPRRRGRRILFPVFPNSMGWPEGSFCVCYCEGRHSTGGGERVCRFTVLEALHDVEGLICEVLQNTHEAILAKGKS